MPIKLIDSYKKYHITLPCLGGMGNALLYVMYAGAIGVKVNNLWWQPQHTDDVSVLQGFVQSQIVNEPCKIINTGFNFQCDQLQTILNSFKKDNGNLRYISKQYQNLIKRKKDTACVHLRFGDFTEYTNTRYIPDQDFILHAVQKLPDSVTNLRIGSNGNEEQVNQVLSSLKGTDKTILYDMDIDESRPDLVLMTMLECGSMIRTGSTLSLCACLMQGYDTIVSSFMTHSPYDTERFVIDLPDSHAIIVP